MVRGERKGKRRQVGRDLPPFVRRIVYAPNVVVDYYGTTDGIEQHRR